MKKLFIHIVIGILLSGSIFCLEGFSEIKPDTFPENFKNSKQYQRYLYRKSKRSGFRTDIPIKVYKDIRSSKKRTKLLSDKIWVQKGPYRPDYESSPEYDGEGRVNCIKALPGNPRILYAGSASGGIYLSRNSGKDWTRFDMTSFMSIGISDIEIAPLQNNVMYAATGDIATPEAEYYSIGIIKSTDRGITWNPTSKNYSLADKMLISEMVIDPVDPDFLTAAGKGGIIRTGDGGKTWEKIYECDKKIIRDIELMPSNPFVIYAASYDISGHTEIIRSEDDGFSWDTLMSFDNIGRIELAVTPKEPNNLYYIGAGHDNRKGRIFGCIDFLSGETRELNLYLEGGDNIVSKQGMYNLLLEINPQNPNDLVAGGVYLYRSKDGGRTFKKIEGVHVDQHDFLFTEDGKQFSANDGGIHRIWDNNEYSAYSQNEGLNITQYYRMEANPVNPDLFYGGSQDNGTKLFINGYRKQVVAADGMEIEIDKQDNSIVYFAIQKGDLFRSDNFGMPPLRYISAGLEQYDSPWLAETETGIFKNEIYTAYRDLFYSSDTGNSWTKLTDFDKEDGYVSALHVGASGEVFLGNQTGLYRCFEGKTDKLCETEMPVSSVINVGSDVYYSLSGFAENKKVFRYDGKNTNISGLLPNIPINCLQYIESENIILAGTDAGVYGIGLSFSNWQLFGSGMPRCIVSDFSYNESAGIIRASTYGCGIFEMELSADQAPENPILNIEGDVKICPGDTLNISVTNPQENCIYISRDNSRGTEIKATSSGLYFFSCLDTVSGSSSSSEVVSVQVREAPKVKMYLLTNDRICPGEICRLRCEVSNFDIADCSFLWSNGDTSTTAGYTESGPAFALVKSPGGCTGYSDTAFVTVHPRPDKPEISKSGNYLICTQAYSYQWYFESEKIEDALGQKLYVRKPGKYFVKVKNEFGCSNSSENFELQIPAEGLAVYPNPAESEINIDGYSETTGSVSISIYDLSGKKVYTKKENNIEGFFSRKIELKKLSIGTYYLKVRINNEEYTRNFIKY